MVEVDIQQISKEVIVCHDIGELTDVTGAIERKVIKYKKIEWLQYNPQLIISRTLKKK